MGLFAAQIQIPGIFPSFLAELGSHKTASTASIYGIFCAFSFSEMRTKDHQTQLTPQKSPTRVPHISGASETRLSRFVLWYRGGIRNSDLFVKLVRAASSISDTEALLPRAGWYRSWPVSSLPRPLDFHMTAPKRLISKGASFWGGFLHTICLPKNG